jgi:uncharacterized protein
VIIDSDVHPTLPGGLGSILPYLDPMWRRRMEPYRDVELMSFPFGRGPHFRGPGGIRRLDAVPPSGADPGTDVEFTITDHMNKNGIDLAILLPLQPSKVDMFTDPDHAAAVVAAYNDAIADQWMTADARFRQGMLVSPHDPQLAAAEVRRFGSRSGVVAVWIPLINRLLGDRYYYPIYEEAQALGLPIILHGTGSESEYIGSTELAGGNPPSRAERYTLLGELAMSNLASLIFSGTFTRFPNLKVIFVEYGWTWVPPLLWRMDAVWKMGRAEMPWVHRSPSETVLEQVRFTTEPALEIADERFIGPVLEMIRAEKTLLFSSDYPHWDGEEPRSVFKNISEDLRRRIFADNAIDTFGERLMAPQPSAR